MIPSFTRGYPASALIAGNRILKFSAASTLQSVAQATANDEPLMGVSDRLGAPSGGMCDVHRGGLVAVQLGGSVDAGDPITANADGKGVEAVAAEGETVRIIGYADQPGVANDIIDVFFAPGLLHEPAGA